MLKAVKDWVAVNEARKGNFPVRLRDLASQLGVEVKNVPMKDELSGLIRKDPSGSFVIEVNANHHPNRQRFTIAHELGHFMLHRGKMGAGISDNKKFQPAAYRSGEKGKYDNELIGKKEETEANKFAANLLMPMDEVKAYYRKTRSVDATASRFGVSKAAMRIRLGLKD